MTSLFNAETAITLTALAIEKINAETDRIYALMLEAATDHGLSSLEIRLNPALVNSNKTSPIYHAVADALRAFDYRVTFDDKRYNGIDVCIMIIGW